MRIAIVTVLTLAVVGANAADTRPAGMSGADVPSYEVRCSPGASAAERCEVDRGTYAGWAFYSRYCESCHGSDATGRDPVPGLLDRVLGEAGYDRVHFVVANGHEGVAGDMPSWADQRAVVEHLDDIYRYLSARAGGALPAGKPTAPED